MDKDWEILREVPLFQGIDEEDCMGMLVCLGSRAVTVPKGQCLHLESDELRCVGVVLSGAVDIRKEDVRGNTMLLERVGKGEVFGETFVCGKNSTSTVTFQAAQPSRILYLSLDRVLRSCSNACVFHQRLIENLVVQLAEKNRRLLEKVEIAARKNLREKILTYLSMEAERQKSRYFRVPMGRQEMAEYLFANRSALSRELENMRRDGLIDFDGNLFTVYVGKENQGAGGNQTGYT